ncbi:major facilitator superfamily domain-containing protein [Fomitopsis serialis]|uniref:major facilitator superfamily domain-containing protein n=1 Tax=Fomitopsis serialis TaxID=139415 RepID=UPI002008357C|nr:major facilitator superfamily domain-containing protein [Neoantrodia serialis]KAH9931316.1 major facilitator superfamily domain-containing protein [Neoantrodia serialis]
MSRPTSASPPTFWQLITEARTQYSRNFHLSWLGFWTASCRGSPSRLSSRAVKSDLKLSTAKLVRNSNIVSLCSTLLVRLIVGPLVDRYGPRKVMAGLLVLGAIPSGLAGTISNASGLYVVRFFIGILGGTFVPCQAWTSAFFDKRVVGRANAIAGGWGNSGGGFTFIIMLAVYDRLIRDGLAKHVAWRASFAIVPVPVLLTVAALTLIFGTDHPNGKWEDRFARPSPSFQEDANVIEDSSSAGNASSNLKDVEAGERGRRRLPVSPANPDAAGVVTSSVDVAVNQPVTMAVVKETTLSPLTWLPSFAYLTTFGFELAVDANLSNVLFSMYQSKTFGQTKAGYIAAIYGLLNVFSRAFGGYFGDMIYRRYGVPGKKYLTLALGVVQGIMSIALGVYIDSRSDPSLAVVIVIFVILALFNEAGNGANFSLVPHCNPNSNGLMTGIVGALGNLGGVFFALIFRMQPKPYGKAFWISGVVAIVVNFLLIPIRVPRT